MLTTRIAMGLCMGVVTLVGPSTSELRADDAFRQAYTAARERIARYEQALPVLRLKPRWIAGAGGPAVRMWYRSDVAGRSDYWTVDPVSGKKQPAIDRVKVASELARALNLPRDPHRLDLDDLEFDDAGRLVRFREGRQVWDVQPDGGLRRRQPDVSTAETNRDPARVDSAPGETRIRFVNRTGGRIELFWVPSAGERRSYGIIPPGDERDQHTFVGHTWQIVDGRGEVVAKCVGEDEPTTVEVGGTRSPDGRFTALVRDHNVVLRRNETGEDRTLTVDGTAEDGYRGEFAWSPDSSHLVAIRVRAGEERRVTLVESAPRDQVQPKTHYYNYLKPGDRLPFPRPRLFDVNDGREIAVAEELFAQPFTETGSLPVQWLSDSSEFLFSYNERGHQRFRVLAVNGRAGTVRVVVDEQPESFFCYSQKQFRHLVEPRGDSAGGTAPRATELIWMSERDGWNHLWLYDVATGVVKNQITRGEWVVRRVEHVDDAARVIWFLAGGVRADEDPYHEHLCRINFDGSGFQRLTEGDGHHRIEWSPDRTLFLDTWSRADHPPVHELRRADGTLVLELERGDLAPLLERGWRLPERFVAKGRDGKTDIHGLIHRPSQIEPGKKYPVIEYIYAGPHGAFVPKEFRPIPDGDLQVLVELGFIVVRCDGMGTNHRSKAFHDVCWKNLGDSGFPDRIAWIKAAAAKSPELDLDRVGIYGGSAGGQSSTRALLAHGDFYKAAVSDCGCHDNRVDKIWWNEQWMGWPIGPHYAEQSNVTQAHRLTGKLLLVVGELDRNVDPASTLQVANALVQADRDFELLVLPGAGHGAAETPYGKRRRAEFFVRHLKP